MPDEQSRLSLRHASGLAVTIIDRTVEPEDKKIDSVQLGHIGFGPSLSRKASEMHLSALCLFDKQAVTPASPNKALRHGRLSFSFSP